MWRCERAFFAPLHHLIGGDDVAAGRVDITFDRVDHDQIAPLGLLDRHELAGLVERRPRRGVPPHRRAKLRIGEAHIAGSGRAQPGEKLMRLSSP